MKKSLLAIAILIQAVSGWGQSASATWAVKFSDAIISRYQPTINTMTGKGWEYSNSIILHGMEKVYANVPNVAYYNYIKAYVDAYVNSSGSISGLAQNMDKIHPGLLCLFLYEKNGLTKYKTAAKKLRDYLLAGTYPKTPDGGYWHKNTAAYKNVLMADGMYMAYPFIVKYGRMFNDPVCYDSATSQILRLASKLYVGSSGLLKHAWNYDKTTFAWSDPVTGVSREVWSRGMGWFMMALVDVLRYLPATHAKYAAIKSLLVNLAAGIRNTQDPATGLWYDIVDKAGSAGNYLETSGSAMFVYSLKIACDSGWVPAATYLPVAQAGWNGVQTTIGTYTDGKPQIRQFAPAMSVQNNYSAYVSIAPVNCPASSGTQHPHGYASLLMAASVMEFPLAAGQTLNPGIVPAEDKISDWAVYPNPTDGSFSARFRMNQDAHFSLMLSDFSGRVLLTRAVEAHPGLNSLSWSLAGLPTGVYLVSAKGARLAPVKLVKR